MRANSLDALGTYQKSMVIKMLGLKRLPDVIEEGKREPWLDFQIRSFSGANQVLSQHNLTLALLIIAQRQSWASHVLRFGTHGRPYHLLKSILFWRPFSWWLHQKIFNTKRWDPVWHPVPGPVRRWEHAFSSNCVLVLGSP